MRFPRSCIPPKEKVDQFLGEEKATVFWSRKNKSFDLKTLIEDLSFLDGETLKVAMRASAQGSMRPDEALGYIFGWENGNLPPISVEKLEVEFRGSNDVQ